ncbi:MAG: hypothetical protein JWM87_1261 [Candidatus Eremiobacteraeota bacterium]|nr:hypothetical protein [Candidatus Eremiobacteraeota bacterium]
MTASAPSDLMTDPGPRRRKLMTVRGRIVELLTVPGRVIENS